MHTSRLKWAHLSNGRLLSAAEEAGFEAIVTVDDNMLYQQNMSERKIRVIVLQSPSNDVPTLAPLAGLVMVALEDQQDQNITIRHPGWQ